MKSSLFARPNLKLFLLGAILVLVANDLFVALRTQASARTLPAVGKAGVVTETELARLRQYLLEHPSSEGYMRLSYYYQKRGEYRQAMTCLLHADRLADDSE